MPAALYPAQPYALILIRHRIPREPPCPWRVLLPAVVHAVTVNMDNDGDRLSVVLALLLYRQREKPQTSPRCITGSGNIDVCGSGVTCVGVTSITPSSRSGGIFAGSGRPRADTANASLHWASRLTLSSVCSTADNRAWTYGAASFAAVPLRYAARVATHRQVALCPGQR